MEHARKTIATASIALSFLAIAGVATPAAAGGMDDLVAAARSEGELNVMALPRDWCGYGAVIDGFEAKYGVAVNELYPDASSESELDALRASRSFADSQSPDVVDVGLAFGPVAKAEGLLRPYKVSAWDSIPAAAKDAEGYWYGDYYGLLAFEVNADAVARIPKDWPDLLAPEFRIAIALAGLPGNSNQANQAIYASGLAAGAGDAAAAAAAGLSYFAELQRAGNLVPQKGDADMLAQGAAPVLLRWDYLAFADRDRLRGRTNIEVVLPESGTVAGVYVQGISAFALHPNAARLWMEYLYSDEVQLTWLKNYCHPIRERELRAAGKLLAKLEPELPPMSPGGPLGDPVFPTAEEQERARDIITNGWDDIVGVEVQCFRPDAPTSSIPGEIAASSAAP